ncbi:MAG TPA: hypothetical protein VGB62_06055 [Allosphingosinicella sp.]|jgi:hypothetical protein
MIRAFRACAIAALAALTPCAAGAAPATPAQASPAGEAVTARIPFDPPLGKALRYRFEKSEEGLRGKKSAWLVAGLVFAKADDGYRMTVTPQDSGDGGPGRASSPVMKTVLDMVKRPYTLILTADAEIVGMEDSEAYWDAAFQAFAAASAGSTATSPTDRQAVEGITRMMRQIPEEARLAMVAESVAPLVEFAGTETVVGEPITTEAEQEAPFGGTMKRNVEIALQKVSDGTAFLSLHSSVPRAEFEAMMAAFMRTVAASQVKPVPGKPIPTPEEIGRIEHFSQETRAEYEVALDTGLLKRHRSTETVEIRMQGNFDRKITTVSLERID